MQSRSAAGERAHSVVNTGCYSIGVKSKVSPSFYLRFEAPSQITTINKSRRRCKSIREGAGCEILLSPEKENWIQTKDPTTAKLRKSLQSHVEVVIVLFRQSSDTFERPRFIRETLANLFRVGLFSCREFIPRRSGAAALSSLNAWIFGDQIFKGRVSSLSHVERHLWRKNRVKNSVTHNGHIAKTLCGALPLIAVKKRERCKIQHS